MPITPRICRYCPASPPPSWRSSRDCGCRPPTSSRPSGYLALGPPDVDGLPGLSGGPCTFAAGRRFSSSETSTKQAQSAFFGEQLD